MNLDLINTYNKFNIVVACDKAYYDKAESLFKSLDLNAKGIKKQILCIGFELERDGYDTATVSMESLKSFRKGFPSNRPFYICAEGGEFLDYFNYNDDDIIIHIDADMILQRGFDSLELEQLLNLSYGQIAGSYTSNPTQTLREEFWRMKPKRGYTQVKEFYNGNWDIEMICAGVVCCTAKTYRDIIFKNYIGGIDAMTKVFDHHAGGQWLMNYIAENEGELIHLFQDFHCGEWFLDIETNIKDNQLYVGENKVLFNHTKFIREWSY